MNPNIILDFTANKAIESLTAGQPLAIMPAELTKRLLKHYASSLVHASDTDIIMRHIDTLRACKDVDEAVETSITFIQERDLIKNVIAEQWDIYAVNTELIMSTSILNKIRPNKFRTVDLELLP